MRQTQFRNTILAVLALAVVLTACAGDSASFETTGGDLSAPTTPTEAAAPEQTAGGEDGVTIDTPEGRKVIHRAAIAIEATDTRSVYRSIQELVDRSDGFIASATVSDPATGEDQPRITMMLRIPAADLTTALEAIGALGTRVVSQSQEGQDVTEEYVDVEARIDNLTLLETELRELLEDVRQQADADPAKLLQVFNEISRVRGEIEQFQGRIQVLDDLTSLATVEVSVVPAPAVAPVVAEEWAPLTVAREALADLVGAFQNLADLGIRLVVFVLPVVLVVLVIPGLIIWKVGGRFTRRGARAGETNPEDQALESADK